MNRIILIGNGFDLAHGLHTSYKHFIDDYWNRKADQRRQLGYSDNDEDVEFISNNRGGNGSYHDSPKISECKDLSSLETYLKQNGINIVFKNRFLGLISKECGLKKWVDIEKEFYHNLKGCMKNHLEDKSKENGIEKLNESFERIKNLLSKYLTGIEIKTDLFSLEIFNRMVSEFKYKEFTQDFKNHFVKEKMKYVDSIVNNKGFYDEENEKALKSKFSTEVYEPVRCDDIEKILIKSNASYYFPDLLPNDFLILNFNYTNTYRLYDDRISEYQRNSKDYCTKEVKVINIHGELNNKNNPIIFGFGDEIDEDYSRIENLDENRYLENIKSTKYHETDNYKKLLEYIDSDYFQIFIFGHSCGLSDRTLLSTLFNHDNCISIKPFYYIKEDGSDNYSDLVRNISRHFKDKASLRDKVVNKTYCEPLTGSK